MTGELRIPFRHHDRDGTVTVQVTRVVNGVDAGFDVLPGLPFGPEAAIGYPSMSATIAYEGTGYRSLTGWLQVVHTRRTWHDGTVVIANEVDLGPVWSETATPYFAYGYPPTIYDAPANNLNGAVHLEWQADTFLTTVPLRSRSEPITRLASFTWGYSESSDPEGSPSILAPAVTSARSWTDCLDLFKRNYPHWSWA